MTSGHRCLGRGCPTAGAGPGADGPARGRCSEAGVTQHDSGRRMVKRESLKEGRPSPRVMAPRGAWDCCTVSCDRCWAVQQKAGGRTRKNLKIRLQTLFQKKQQGCTSPGMVSPTRRVALSCSLTRGQGSLGMLHPPSPSILCRLTKRTAAANGRRTAPRSHSGCSLGPPPHHEGLLSPGISRDAASGLAL